MGPERGESAVEERQEEEEDGAERGGGARGLEQGERAREEGDARVGRAFRGGDGEGEARGRGGGGRRRGKEGRGGAEAGGEAVLVEAVFGPGAGVGDAAGVLDGREGGLGADGLRGGWTVW